MIPIPLKLKCDTEQFLWVTVCAGIGEERGRLCLFALCFSLKHSKQWKRLTKSYHLSIKKDKYLSYKIMMWKIFVKQYSVSTQEACESVEELALEHQAKILADVPAHASVCTTEETSRERLQGKWSTVLHEHITFICWTDFNFCYKIQIVPVLSLFSAPYQSSIHIIPWSVR